MPNDLNSGPKTPVQGSAELVELERQSKIRLLPVPGPWPSVDDAAHVGPNGHGGPPAPRLTPEQSFVLDDDQPLLAAVVEAACEDLAECPHPLVLCGPPGSGKSHLARGIGEIWTARFGANARGTTPAVVILGGTEFVKQFIQAGERDRLSDWQARLRNARLLVLDDINQLSTNPRAINELRFTLDELTANGGRAIVTSRLSPELIAGMTPSLAARLQAGVVETLRTPGPPVRAALWERFAVARAIALDESALRTLSQIKTNAVEIWLLLEELAVGETGARRIDAERVKDAFAGRNGFGGRGTTRPNVRAMTNLAAKYFGIKVPEMLGPTRRRSVVTARNLVIYLARQLGEISLEQLGKHFGGRDHTTVLHGYRVIEERLRSDPELRQAHDDLRKMLVQGGG